jgi:hypothetical protein
MSDTCKANLIKGMKASFADFEQSTLPKYTLEELSEEIEKGERSFFTPKALGELQDLLSKSEMDDETSLSFAEQIKDLEKVAIVKGEEITGYGYFLEKATYKDNPANRKAGKVGQTYGGSKKEETSEDNSVVKVDGGQYKKESSDDKSVTLKYVGSMAGSYAKQVIMPKGDYEKLKDSKKD